MTAINQIEMKQCCKENLQRFKDRQHINPEKSQRVDSIICPKCKIDFRQAKTKEALEVRVPRKIKPPSRPKRVRS